MDVGRQDKGSRVMQPIGGYVLGQTVKVFAFHERETLLYFAPAVVGPHPRPWRRSLGSTAATASLCGDRPTSLPVFLKPLAGEALSF